MAAAVSPEVCATATPHSNAETTTAVLHACFIAGLEHGTAAHPLRDDPFFPALRRTPRVQGPQIRLFILEHVDEEEAPAKLTLVRDAEHRHVGLAARVVLVQVQQIREDTLTVFGDLLVE